MRLRVALILLAFLCAAPLAQQPANPPATMTLSGLVTTANDVPLPRVRVATPAAVPDEFARMGIRPASQPGVLTDANGLFTIRVLASTSIRLAFIKARYITETAALSPRELAAGGSDIGVRLSLAGAISGQVLDRFGGGPLMSATVLLRRAGTDPDAAPLSVTTTDDLGEYRFGGLAPGRYVVTARPAVTALGADIPDRQAIVDAATVEASPIDVSAGTEVSGLILTVDTPSEVDQGGNRLVSNPDATASVSGRVVGADGRPVARAVVHAYRPYIAGRQVETDQGGRYRIDRLVPGEYTVEVRKFGFENGQYGQRMGAARGRPITLKSGEAAGSIDVTLLRGGAIAGTVVDEFGEPAQDVVVGAIELRAVDGRIRAVPASALGGGRTNDRGQYRMYGMRPGTYFVQATVADALPAGSGYPPLLYPGAMTFDQATRTTVNFGSDIRGIDFALIATAAYRITGTAYDSTGNPVRGEATLAVSERSGAIQTLPKRANLGPDGSFEFTNVGPGEYVVQADGTSIARGTGSLPTTIARQFASAFVLVGGSDPPPLTLRLAQGATLMGRTRYDGLPAGPTPLLTLGVQPADAGPSPLGGYFPMSADVRQDGSFLLTGVFGPTRIQAQTQRSDWYVKSVVFKGQDI